MLFGGKTVQANIVSDAMKFAEEKGFKLIFGAMVGGCSKGVQYYDSDYDTRFLYLDKNAEGVFYPWQEKEEALKHRKYFDAAVSPYEWIPLWEATSFFQFLKNPAFDGKQSFGLYNIIGWTLQSPYTWDPYGLAAKIMPLVNAVFRQEYYVPYHVEEIHKLWPAAGDEIIAKNYIYAVYEALCILYADTYHAFPPVSMKTLILMLLDDSLAEELLNMIRAAQKASEEYCRAGGSKNMHDSHFWGMLKRRKPFDDLIQTSLERAQNMEASSLKEEVVERQIARIYRVMEEAIYREQRVQRAEDL